MSKILSDSQRASADRPKRHHCHLLVVAICSAVLQVDPASAQSIRTFVSLNGSDGNACTVGAPCRTFSGALKKTSIGGEINALSSGDFGPVTISQAVTLTGADIAAGVLGTSAGAITITAGPSDVVQLSGLYIDGGGVGQAGIQFNSGASLMVRNTTIRGFAFGLYFSPQTAATLAIQNSLVNSNSTGLVFAGPTSATLSGINLISNANGILAIGVNAGAAASITLQGSVIANNNAVGVVASGYASIAIANTTIANNAVGLASLGGGSVIQLNSTSVSGNGTGFMASNSGQFVATKTNAVGGNKIGNTIPATPAPTPPTPTPPPPPKPAPTTSFLLDSSNGYILDENGAPINGS